MAFESLGVGAALSDSEGTAETFSIFELLMLVLSSSELSSFTDGSVWLGSVS